MNFPEYDQYDGLGLAALIASGELNPMEVLEACMDRIAARNPALNAMVHTSFTRARHQITSGDVPQGPFHGVPFVLKDLHGEDGGQPCTASCRMLANWRAPQDCELVRRYKKAGVVIVGRTNTPEFGIYATTEPELRGPTRNPWNLRHTTGGSSGGTAAAVAARIVPLGHGNDGGGSIRIPSAHCGLFGLKPSRGRIPSGPYRAEGWGGLSIDHVLTRSVRDSAAMLDATHGPDPGAPYTARTPDRPFLKEVGAAPGTLRIAYTEEPLFGDTTHPDCVQAVRDAAMLARDLGHEVEEARPDFDRRTLTRAYLFLVSAGVSVAVQETGHLIGRPPRREDFELATWMFKVLGDSVTASEYVQYRSTALQSGFQLASFFDTWDIFLTPTAALPPVEL
ncbi:MAG: amidase, partial [Myxococcota bacterium]